ncbi:MAG: aminopeptidase P family protein [Candidatus Hydrogenedentes bacterium]|nr:aminopeptidase P family protein [Candidatus Hydrogenedentota bacterium]
MHQQRIQRVREQLQDRGSAAFFSFSPADNEYLTGFRGTTSAVIIAAREALFLCDFRYIEQAKIQVKDYEIEQITGTFETRVGERLAALGVGEAVFEPTTLTVYQLETLRKAFEGTVESDHGIVGRARERKSEEELARLRAASHLAEQAMLDLVAELKPGMQEQEFAAMLEYEFKRRGATGASFPSIVLFGAHSSLPHGVPGTKRLEDGDIVLLDLGCVHQSYCSDLTRTFVFGTIPPAWFEEIYNVTLSAQQAALRAVRPGASCKDVDNVAREMIREAGFGDYFGHGLGHGVGLEIHESPRLNMQSEAVLEAGMVVTVEPGIYLPGRGGVRIEDLVFVTPSGCEVVTQSSKELKVLSA